MIINIPIGGNWEQGKSNENEYEEHKSVWSYSDFNIYPHKKIKKFRDYCSRRFCVVLLSGNEFNFKKNYRKKYGKFYRAKMFLKNIPDK